MRRGIAAVLSLICFGTVAAASPTGRTVEKPYQVIEAVIDPPQNLYLHGRHGVPIRTRAGERFVDITIVDVTGWKVPATVFQDKGDDGITESSHAFCGATDRPVPIVPKIPIIVYLGEGSCSATDVLGYGSYTKGTITATFSRQP